MKICIDGVGAIGGYLEVMLKQGGAGVSIARGAHLAVIKASRAREPEQGCRAI
jgi:ketopantoate reductase